MVITGADGIMIGRAALNNPWIFRDVAHYLDTGELLAPAGCIDRLNLALRQLEMLTDEVSERFAILNMRKYFGWYSRGAQGGAQFRRDVFRAETREGVEHVVTDFCEKLQLQYVTDTKQRAVVGL